MLALEPMHGWAIAARIQQTSQEVLQMQKTETGRDAKFYTLARPGHAQLEEELAQWERLSRAVGLVIRMAED